MTYLEEISDLVSRLNTDSLRQALADSERARARLPDETMTDLMFEAACFQELINRGLTHVYDKTEGYGA